jgi:stearoyl-CoA desaturase (delta-9 desaturase)
MNSIAKKSRQYYLLFNLPIQLLALVGISLGFINFAYVLVFYVAVYWLGIQAGSHKLFTHRSWEPKYIWIKYIIAILSCFGLMGGPVIWANMHRVHHANSDTDKDPHSPMHGMFHAYFGWLLNPPTTTPIIVKDHLRDKPLIIIDKYCREIVLAILVLLFIINYEIAFSLTLAMTITFHSEMMVNSFLHGRIDNTWGAKNNVWLSLISGGSTLHKNHHGDPGNCSFSKKWYEFDPSMWIIKVLQK